MVEWKWCCVAKCERYPSCGRFGFLGSSSVSGYELVITICNIRTRIVFSTYYLLVGIVLLKMTKLDPKRYHRIGLATRQRQKRKSNDFFVLVSRLYHPPEATLTAYCGRKEELLRYIDCNNNRNATTTPEVFK